MIVDVHVDTRERQSEEIDSTAGINNQMELRGVLTSRGFHSHPGEMHDWSGKTSSLEIEFVWGLATDWSNPWFKSRVNQSPTMHLHWLRWQCQFSLIRPRD